MNHVRNETDRTEIKMKIPFGMIDDKTLKLTRAWIGDPLASGQLTEGPLTREFERQFAAKFGWKYAIATSSGTTAGEVVWAAIRELRGGFDRLGGASTFGEVLTPACAFVSTASCILASGSIPHFVDIEATTLNIAADEIDKALGRWPDGFCGIQHVATMGSLIPLKAIADLAEGSELHIVCDLCEAHGARLDGELPNAYLDAAIYSLYPAHMVVGVEGGVICTDNEKIASLCRSVKSHGRPEGSNYFDFQRVGFNAKWSDLHACVGLASLEGFDERFAKRRWVRQRLLEELSRFEDEIILYRDGPDEIIAPHAFPVVLRKDGSDTVVGLRSYLDGHEIEVKTLFGSLPTQHKAFEFLGHSLGDFPVAERIGRTGLHFGCGEFMEEEHVKFIGHVFDKFFSK